MRALSTHALALLLVLTAPSSALAAWPNSPFTNLPVSTAPDTQLRPVMVSDGAGGAIIAWYDLRTGSTYDIYAHHILASGSVDPAWPVNGLLVCNATNNQMNPVIVSDGAGGAIVAWQDLRSGTDVYAQHVLVSGTVDPAWPLNGRAICTALAVQQQIALVSDGAGGAIATWNDLRTANDLYAQRVLASGVVDPAWPLDGRAVCTTTGPQTTPAIVSDGANGAIITWVDQRGATTDIYAHRVLASGVVDPAWPVDGRAVCLATGNQAAPAMASDGNGGAVIAWQDPRSGTTNDIYAGHVLATGAVDPIWPVDGRAISVGTGSQQTPAMVSDDASGALITWQDNRSGNFDVYAHHVLGNGTVDPAWPADGRSLCTAAGQQDTPVIAADGAGGAYVAWNDLRSGVDVDAYLHHVLASGAVDPGWPANGRGVSTAGNNQNFPVIVTDANGGVLVSWQDARGGGNDIYAQRVGRYSYLGTPEAELTGVTDVPGDQGGRVKLSWKASYLEGDPSNLVTSYKVFRSVPPNLVAALLASESASELLVTELAGATYYWEFLATVNADFLPTYSYLAATPGDSTAAGVPETAYMIQARTAGSQHWESLPMSGYSVDDLAPAAPAPLTGVYGGGTTALHWNPNVEADLFGYRLYRGADASFVPSPGNLLAALPDTGYVDTDGGAFHYKLTAVDVHGNESPVATLSPSGTVSVGDVVAELWFAAPAPNPTSSTVAFRFALPRSDRARLGLYDASGRLVRVLADGVREAGVSTVRWDLRDGDGRAVPAGLYFARLDVAGQVVRTHRVAVAR